jgi:hypothetical protein
MLFGVPSALGAAAFLNESKHREKPMEGLKEKVILEPIWEKVRCKLALSEKGLIVRLFLQCFS